MNTDNRLPRPNTSFGTVKWWHPTRGYGFVELDRNSEIYTDVFVQASAISTPGFGTLIANQRVKLELDQDLLRTKGPIAKQVWIIGAVGGAGPSTNPKKSNQSGGHFP